MEGVRKTNIFKRAYYYIDDVMLYSVNDAAECVGKDFTY